LALPFLIELAFAADSSIMSSCSREYTFWMLLLLCVFNSAYLIPIGKSAQLTLEHRAPRLNEACVRRRGTGSSQQQCRMSLVDRKMPVGDVSSAKIGVVASMEDFEAAVALSAEDKLVIFKAYVPW
jgi:hypothetical protein